jgi:hypothetical protein
VVATSYEFGDEFQRHALAVLARIPGGVLRYRSALDYTYFGSASLRKIAEVLFTHVDEHHSLPQEATLIEEVREAVGEDDFSRVRKVAARLYKEDVSDAKAVLAKLIDFGQQQAYINATVAAADKLDRGDRDIRPLFDAASIVGQDLLDIGVDYKGDAEERREWYRNPQLQNEDIIRTGIPHLDAMLDGGIDRGELGVILAPPKRGKTSTLINIGFGALTSVRRYNVVHYSLEMDQDKVSRRYDDRLMGGRVKFKKSRPDRYADMLDERLRRAVRGRLFVKSYPTRAASISNVRSHLSLLAARGVRPDMVIVDYADIMKPERRLGEMRHEQAGIYEDLRQLAGEFNAAVWTGSQASRGALEKDVITIEDFAEAFEKAAIVDAAVAFCQSNDERIERKCRLFGAALRNQEDGRTVECEIHRDQCRIRSLALYDVAGARTLLDGIDAGEEDYAATESGVRKAKKRSTKQKAERIKGRAGMKKAKKRSARRKVARKPSSRKATEKTARRRRDRPSKHVRLEDA